MGVADFLAGLAVAFFAGFAGALGFAATLDGTAGFDLPAKTALARPTTTRASFFSPLFACGFVARLGFVLLERDAGADAFLDFGFFAMAIRNSLRWQEVLRAASKGKKRPLEA